MIDGTYELFRHFFAMPPHLDRGGRDVAATRGVLMTVIGMLEGGVSHVGVATDHVIESFRNALWPGYKTGAGVEARLLAQFPVVEEALGALGVVVWPMVELEADDALGAAARRAAELRETDRVLIGSPDKDLAQCVRGEKVVQLDRRSGRVTDEAGVVAKFGVSPASIPDYLALVGDSADGFPGLPGWGAKSAAVLLARYDHIETIPRDAADWQVEVRSASRLAATLRDDVELAFLFRDLATLRTEAPPFESLDELRWTGPTAEFAAICERLNASDVRERVERLRA